MRSKFKKWLVWLFFVGVAPLVFSTLSPPASASELIFTPVNPSFGGSPLNASWLMQQAQVQDRFKAKPVVRPVADPLKTFADNLSRQVLSRLQSQIVSAAFGETGLPPGTYDIGNYHIVLSSSDTEITVNITDTTTGNSTTVAVPYY